MTYQELLDAAVRVREKYNQLNARNHGGAWDGDKLMAGFVGDVVIIDNKNAHNGKADGNSKYRIAAD